MTIREALAHGANRLNASGIETSHLDTLLLLCNALRMSKEQIYARLPENMPADAQESFERDLSERVSGVPVAYILGTREFFGREFEVTHDVLVPRPDTEILVETALELIDSSRRPLRLHDCCTGSGCVAITIQAERPQCEVSASDMSEPALRIAARNAEAILGRPIPLFRSNLLAAVPGTFDIITANPPYLTSGEVAEKAEACWPEPLMALEGGPDGLDLVRILVGTAVASLAPYGYICIETADPQVEDTRTIMMHAGFADIETRKDLAGRRRVTLGRRSI